MVKKLTNEEESVIKTFRKIKRLCNQFGLVMCAFDPGVAGYVKGHGGWRIDFDKNTWKFIEPLLKELVKYRNKYGTNTSKRKANKKTRNMS